MHHQGTKRVEYWSSGVLEYWGFKKPLLHHSNTPSLLGWTLGAALWLTGCMVGPDYQKPPVSAPGVFRGAVPTSPDPKSIADLKWFEVFKDEELQELIRTALVHNYDLRDAVARVEAARANLGITQADQYPNFGVGADYTAIEASRRGAQTIPSGVSRERSYTTVFLN